MLFNIILKDYESDIFWIYLKLKEKIFIIYYINLKTYE